MVLPKMLKKLLIGGRSAEQAVNSQNNIGLVYVGDGVLKTLKKRDIFIASSKIILAVAYYFSQDDGVLHTYKK